MIVDTKDFDCPTCRHHRTGSCDTWCDCGEAYEPNLRALKEAIVRCKVCANRDNPAACPMLHYDPHRGLIDCTHDEGYCDRGDRRRDD